MYFIYIIITQRPIKREYLPNLKKYSNKRNDDHEAYSITHLYVHYLDRFAF